MRIRHKPWCRPELEACPFYILKPEEKKGAWRKLFPKDQPLYLEVGCGKGGFISQAASSKHDVNFIAMDIKNEMLGLAKRKIEQAYKEKDLPCDNILIAIQNIELIQTVFSKEDSVERMYINFCNPWPRPKHKKRRLTHPRQLEQYKSFLAPDGEIWFKTDNDELFEESVEYFKECGFEIRFITRDLHNSGFTENFVTEHESMFTAEGIPTKFLIAVNKSSKSL